MMEGVQGFKTLTPFLWREILRLRPSGILVTYENRRSNGMSLPRNDLESIYLIGPDNPTLGTRQPYEYKL